MVHRIVVRVSPNSTVRTSQNGPLFLFLTFVVVVALVLLVVASGMLTAVDAQMTAYGSIQLWFGLSDRQTTVKDSIVWGIPVFLVVFILGMLGKSQSNTTLIRYKGISIMMYAWGIQLCEVVVTERRDGTIHYHPLNSRFIPRDSILDCIVTELVLAHRVQSMVALRTTLDMQRPQSDPRSNDNRIHLISALPGVQLSYKECLIVRHEVMQYLKD